MAATAALSNDPARLRRGGHGERRPVRWGTPLTYALALAVAAVSIAPVVYVILGGFRTTGQIAANPAGLPHPWVWGTYAKVVPEPKFWAALLNTTLVPVFTPPALAPLPVAPPLIP